MQRRFLIAATLALALAACATSDHAYRHADGSYSGAYDDGYYAAAGNGHGDYYYDRPQYVYSDYYGYGAGCYRFGYGFVPRGWSFGARFGYDPWFDGFCGYNAWYGFGYPYGWYRPWPHHRRHDAGDGRFGALMVRALGAQDHPAAMHSITAPRTITVAPVAMPRDHAATGFERVRGAPRMDAADRAGRRFERGEAVEHRSNRRDASQR